MTNSKKGMKCEYCKDTGLYWNEFFKDNLPCPNCARGKAEPKDEYCPCGEKMVDGVCPLEPRSKTKKAEPKPEGGLEAVIHEQLSRGLLVLPNRCNVLAQAVRAYLKREVEGLLTFDTGRYVCVKKYDVLNLIEGR